MVIVGRVEVTTPRRATMECDADELLRIAAERAVNDATCLELSRSGTPYPALTLWLAEGVGVVGRIDQDPMRPGGELGTETFITAGDGSVPVGEEVHFVDVGGGLEVFTGEVIVGEARALAIVRAFADDLDWPPDTRWISTG